MANWKSRSLPALCLVLLALSGHTDASRAPDKHKSRAMLQAEEPRPTYAQLTDSLRSSIVRIQMIQRPVNWLEPYVTMPESTALGTGFAAYLVSESEGRVPADVDTDPIFLTNAHVVLNAFAVKIQFPAAGQERFDGYVPVIYPDHDLAVVKLLEPASFLKYLRRMNFTLRPLPIRSHQEVMGQPVTAIGFPLGSETLKLSTGVIAGTESTDGRTVYQCTAPISPGSSGGPLLVLGDPSTGMAVEEMRVVGVNFASVAAGGAENVNYVIPVVHVKQIIHEFQALESRRKTETPGPMTLEAMVEGKEPQQNSQVYHKTLKLAPIGAIAEHANEALYAYGGCKHGVYLSKISEYTALHNATPRVENGSFVMSVDGVKIDSFGMGRVEGLFLGDTVPFGSLMQVKERVEDIVKIVTCRNQTITTHQVSMVHWPAYERGIRMVIEPFFEPAALDYEAFADVTFMQMSLNHVRILLSMGAAPPFGRWMMEENTISQRLLITKVSPGTYASTVLSVGMVVASVNGKNVSNLSQLRANFEPNDGQLWSLVTDRGVDYMVNFAETFMQQMVQCKQGLMHLHTPALQQLAMRHGFMAPQGDQATTAKIAQLLSGMLGEAFKQGLASGLRKKNKAIRGGADLERQKQLQLGGENLTENLSTAEAEGKLSDSIFFVAQRGTQETEARVRKV